MKFAQIVLVVILSCATAFATAIYVLPKHQNNAVPAAGETAFERVMRTKTLRCGYILWPPYLIKDTTSGRLSGYTYDVANALAENIGIKIDWVQEVLLGQEVETIRSGRADAICGAQVPLNPVQATVLDHSVPYSYVPTYAYVRSDDSRYPDIKDVNKPATTIATMDGDISTILSRALFPQAKTFGLPSSADPKEMSFDVVNHKADVAILDEPSFIYFVKAYPNSLKRIPTDRPLAYYPFVLSVKKDDGQLRELIDNSIYYLQNSGQLDAILDHDKTDEFGIMRLREPYRMMAK